MVYLLILTVGIITNLYDFLIFMDMFNTLYFTVTSFFFNTSSVFFTYVFVFNLVCSWFFIVWLRMNLLSFSFDQVASYTWHEMVIYTIFLLIEVIVGVWVL